MEFLKNMDIIKKLKLEVPQAQTKVLLHACCAPCSAAIVECLLANNITPTIFYFNPNIFPRDEYQHRKDESMRHAKLLGLDYIEGDSDHNLWLSCVKGLENEPERGARCLKCFQIRLLATAKCAAENGFKVFTTTLASSRWKDLEQINAAGIYAQNAYPQTLFWQQNWRKGGLSERRNILLKQNNFYNQLYCGCEFSIRKD